MHGVKEPVILDRETVEKLAKAFGSAEPQPKSSDKPILQRTSVTGAETIRDTCNRTERGLDDVKATMESRGSPLRRKGAVLEFARPNKTDQSHSISGSLGVVTKEGNDYLKNWSTNDPLLPVRP